VVSLDGVAPSWMVGVLISFNLPLHHKVQKFSPGTGSPGWSRKKGRKTFVMMVVAYAAKSANVQFRLVVQLFAPRTYCATHLVQKIQFISAMCSFLGCQQCAHKY